MKNMFKLLFAVMLMFVFSGNMVKAADTVDVTVSTTIIDSDDVFGTGAQYSAGAHTTMLKKVGNDSVYCADYNNDNLTNGTFTYTFSKNASDQVGYICNNRNTSSNADYYVTTAAIWYYVHENAKENIPFIRGLYNSYPQDNTNVKAAQDLIDRAKNGQAVPTVTFNKSSAAIQTKNINNEYYYVYGPINIKKTNSDKATLTLSNNSIGAIVVGQSNSTTAISSITSNDTNIYISVKASNVTSSSTIGLKAEVSATLGLGKIYVNTSNNYQDILVCDTTTKKANDSINVEFKKNTHPVVISKVDIAGSSEIPGATLIIKDSKGNTKVEWISSEEPKTFNLESGTYTLEETIAPDGYIKSTEKINFSVSEDGKVAIGDKEIDKLVMKNEPIKVIISKKSINGRSELPGAKLKITDKETGKIVKDLDGKSLEWVSGNKEVTFHLGKGVYILSETIAPKGYELSDTVLEFTVTEDGKVLVDKKEQKNNLIVFKNTPEAEQVPTGSKFIYMAIIGILSIAAIAYFGLKKKN